MPQANSITSRPRCTSPRASETTLPCSSEIASASRWMLALTSSRKLNRTLVRCESDDCPQRSNAAFAVRTAESTSSTLASATSACCSPVAGFQTGLVRSEDPATGLPPIQCVMVLNGPPPSPSAGVLDSAGQRQAGVDLLAVPEGADPGVRRVVADLPDPLGVRACHDVEVVEVVAGRGHRRAVPAVGDEDRVARADLGADVDLLARARAVHPLVAAGAGVAGRVGGVGLEVVDLLQPRLVRRPPRRACAAGTTTSCRPG